MIDELAPVVPGTVARTERAGVAEHPMRRVTRQIAFEPDGWTSERQAKLVELFDGLAPTWPTADEIGLVTPLTDAFDRGLAAAPPARRSRLVDLGGGNGRATGIMAEQFPGTVIVDLSFGMLIRVPAGLAHRIQADAARLPFPGGSIDVLVCANMFLFPDEAVRVLGHGGVLVWVNSWGADTPIHLRADEVDAALPGDWAGVASAAGEGTWSVHWRSR